MVSRKRSKLTTSGSSFSSSTGESAPKRGPSRDHSQVNKTPNDKSHARRRDARTDQRRQQRQIRRSRLVETLEARQLLAGPQLLGIQPNEGELIVDGSVRNTAPRTLTLRFDQNQTIDPATFEGIEIVRAGADGQFDPTGFPATDDIVIEPALVSAGANASNEVVVRFAESLPDDQYQVRINSFDDPDVGIVALRNTEGEAFVSRSDDARTQTIGFDLRLGALVESVVPQPVIRNADGTLTQNRDEIVVYFNEDPLFVEDEFSAVLNDNGVDLSISVAASTFDDTTIEIVTAPTGGDASVEYVESTNQLFISVLPNTTVGELIGLIGAIPRFEASTSGSSAAVFSPPAGVAATITARATARSAENPRFYQLLLTQDTVRTTDDSLYFPEEVVYDARVGASVL